MKSDIPLFSLFSKYPHLVVAVSTKKDKQMKVRYELETDKETLTNRKQFLSRLSITNFQVVSAKLVHKNTVTIVDINEAGRFIEETDGLITNKKNLFLALTVADCLPIFIYDPIKEVVCLLHAGWRGLDSNIITKGVALMQKKFTSLSENLIVGVGPGIDVCHFAVKDDVLSRFMDYTNVVKKGNTQVFLNLKQIAKQQLIRNGIKENNIEISPLCTFCEKDKYYSYRRDKAAPLQAMLAVIGLTG